MRQRSHTLLLEMVWLLVADQRWPPIRLGVVALLVRMLCLFLRFDNLDPAFSNRLARLLLELLTKDTEISDHHCMQGGATMTHRLEFLTIPLLEIARLGAYRSAFY